MQMPRPPKQAAINMHVPCTSDIHCPIGPLSRRSRPARIYPVPKKRLETRRHAAWCSCSWYWAMCVSFVFFSFHGCPSWCLLINYTAAPDSPPNSITSTFNSTGGSSPTPGQQSNNNYDGESGIWTYDTQSKQWTAIWTNPDSSTSLPSRLITHVMSCHTYVVPGRPRRHDTIL